MNSKASTIYRTTTLDETPSYYVTLVEMFKYEGFLGGHGRDGQAEDGNEGLHGRAEAQNSTHDNPVAADCLYTKKIRTPNVIRGGEKSI